MKLPVIISLPPCQTIWTSAKPIACQHLAVRETSQWEKQATEWQTDIESDMKFKYNDVVSCLGALPNCHLLPDLTQNITLSSPLLSLFLVLSPSALLSSSLSVLLSVSL